MGQSAEAGSILEVLAGHVSERGSQVAYAFLATDGSVSSELSYAELDRAARSVAMALAPHAVERQPVLVLCPSGPDYVAAVFGCFHARAIAVPAYPPSRMSLVRASARVVAIAEDAGAKLALCTSEVLACCTEAGHSLGALELVEVSWRDAVAGPDRATRPIDWPSADGPAILQYTSGSTSTPKGVLLTHGQVLANQELICAGAKMSSEDIFLSWLPPYHDMGLMAGTLLPVFLGARGVLMPADAFIRRPKVWLTAAQTFGATVLMAPNFALDLCARRITPQERVGLDLSSVRLLANGAEPINPVTVEAFAAAFGPSQLRSEATYPCYGMAEATLIISGGDPTALPVVRSYEISPLEEGTAVRADPDTSSDQGSQPDRVRPLVGCGRALLDERILIVDPDTRATLGPRRVGEIWVQSRSVALGYWKRPEETEQTFRAYTSDTNEGPFLRTGDLGFLDDGELFVTGRIKDLIIVRGRNHHPHDIERTVQGVHEALVKDAGAAFSVEGDAGEQLVVVQELDKRVGADPEELLRSVAQAIREEHDLAVAALVLIKRGSMLKTSSGKIQRRATKQAYLDGDLQVVAEWSLAGRDGAEASEPPPPHTLTRPVALRREEQIADHLRALLAAKLKRRPDELDPAEPLARYGVDSLLVAELTEELERWLGRELPPTLSYDHPTIADLARALAQLTDGSLAARPPHAPERPRSRPRSAPDDPIAIVGMACRFPGAPDLAGFWNVLRHGVDAITEVPPDRWDADALYDPTPGVPGKMCSKWGGFVEGIGEFDPGFFGISEREAARMDPQQRMFLELAWHALEDAGQAPSAIAGTATGVLAGVCSTDYALLFGGDLRLVDVDYGTGNAPSIVANRLSYFLDLKGPSMTLDSACSSALLALQQASQSLRELECDLAIVGAVNAVLAPESSVYFSQARALARDGRCKSFDSRADGFVRSEGGGVVVLKPLSRALADGDRIYALVAGGAVNHDGRSNGLLAPNGKAQQALLRRAFDAAGIEPSDLDYVEAHGVGTPVADAVELRSLGEVITGRSPHTPLLVGSAKTNVGHLEAASGMVSLIKVALALHHQEIPPHLHLRDFHPDIGIDALPIAVPTVPTPWRRGDRPRFAGLSTFGFGGSNAHVVLREAPLPAPQPSERERPRHLLTLSAKDERALDQLVARFCAELQRLPDGRLADAAFTANVGRSHFGHRLAFSAASLAEARELLSLAREKTPDSRVHRAAVPPGARLSVGIAFPHSTLGHGSGRALYDDHPKFREVLELCDRVLRPELEQPLLDVLYGDGSAHDRALLQRPSFAQAAIVALQYALYTLLRELGLGPVAVFGAGGGEYAAAAAASVLPWEQALRLAARRGIVIEGLTPGATQRLTVHQFQAALTEVEWHTPSVPFVSAALDRAFSADEAPSTEHFVRQLYHESRPDDAPQTWLAQDCDVWIDLGPPNAGTQPHDERRLHALSANGDDWATWLDALARLHVLGATLDFRAFDAPYARRKLSLPGYPFQKRRYWLDFPERNLEPAPPTVIERPSSHPLISRVRVHAPPRSGFVRKNDPGDEGQGAAGAE